jgi:uncharacterized protein DUF397
MNEAGPQWRKASRCDSNHCVEVATTRDSVGIRDSTLPPEAPYLALLPEEYGQLVKDFQEGRLVSSAHAAATVAVANVALRVG